MIDLEGTLREGWLMAVIMPLPLMYSLERRRPAREGLPVCSTLKAFAEACLQVE